VLLDRVGESTNGHHCVVAGRRVDGALTDLWGEVSACPDGRYVAYVPRCECGWTGPSFSNTPAGYAACQQLWRYKHLQPFLRARTSLRQALDHRTAEAHPRWLRTVSDATPRWVP